MRSREQKLDRAWISDAYYAPKIEMGFEHDYGWWPYMKWCKNVHSCMASFYYDDKTGERASETFDY
jgi:hypothetical protein